MDLREARRALAQPQVEGGHPKYIQVQMGPASIQTTLRRPRAQPTPTQRHPTAAGFPRASCATSATFPAPAWCSSASVRSSRIGFTPPWPSTPNRAVRAL